MITHEICYVLGNIQRRTGGVDSDAEALIKRPSSPVFVQHGYAAALLWRGQEVGASAKMRRKSRHPVVEHLKWRIKKIDLRKEGSQQLPAAHRHDRTSPSANDRPFGRHFLKEKPILPVTESRDSELLDKCWYWAKFLFQEMIDIEKGQGQFLGENFPRR